MAEVTPGIFLRHEDYSSSRHCEERSDEAIWRPRLNGYRNPRLLRCARNDSDAGIL